MAVWCRVGRRTPALCLEVRDTPRACTEHWAQDLRLLSFMDTNFLKRLIVIQELCSTFYAFVPHFSSQQELEGTRNTWGAGHKAEVSPEKAVAKPQFLTATCLGVGECDLGERGWLSCISCLLGKLSMAHIHVSVMELQAEKSKCLTRRVFSCQSASQSSAFLTFSFVLCAGLVSELAKQGLLGNGQSPLPAAAGLDPSFWFHVAPYTDGLLQTLGRSQMGETFWLSRGLINLTRGFSWIRTLGIRLLSIITHLVFHSASIIVTLIGCLLLLGNEWKNQ